MNRFEDEQYPDKGQEDYDYIENDNHVGHTLSKSFISSVPSTVQNVSIQTEKSLVNSTPY